MKHSWIHPVPRFVVLRLLKSTGKWVDCLFSSHSDGSRGSGSSSEDGIGAVEWEPWADEVAYLVIIPFPGLVLPSEDSTTDGFDDEGEEKSNKDKKNCTEGRLSIEKSNNKSEIKRDKSISVMIVIQIHSFHNRTWKSRNSNQGNNNKAKAECNRTLPVVVVVLMLFRCSKVSSEFTLIWARIANLSASLIPAICSSLFNFSFSALRYSISDWRSMVVEQRVRVEEGLPSGRVFSMWATRLVFTPCRCWSPSFYYYCSSWLQQHCLLCLLRSSWVAE